MASIISAGTSTGTALNLTGDTSGILQLASNNGTVGLTVTAAQNVGIGSVAPVSKLEVVNTGVATLYIGYNNTSFNYLDADNNIFRSGAGVERMRISSTGSLSINNSTPKTWYSPAGVAQFGLAGAVYGNTGVNQIKLLNNLYYDTGGNSLYTNTGYAQDLTLDGSGNFIFYNSASGTAGGTVTEIAALTINQTGTLSLKGGTAGTNGVGITFPATQSASSDANTLDDYEEGTWTPTDASGAGLSLAISSANYTKIGNTVRLELFVTYPTTANGAAALIGGLPFSSVYYSIGATRSTIGVPIVSTGIGTSVYLQNSSNVGITNAQLSGTYVTTTIIYNV